MYKKIQAIILVTLFISTGFMAIPQVAAHYSLGQQGANGWMGAGGSTTDSTTPGNALANHPDAGPSANAWGTFGRDANATVVYALPGKGYVPINQLPGQVPPANNYYSPDGAILTDTTGDMWFYVNVSAPINITWDVGIPPTYGPNVDPGTAQGFNVLANWFYIAIPPEFGVPEGWNDQTWAYDTMTENGGFGNAGNVLTSITNDYRYIQVGKFTGNMLNTPGWWFVRISAPNVAWPGTLTAFHPALALPAEQGAAADVLGLDHDGDGVAVVDDALTGSFGTDSGALYPAWEDPWIDRQVAAQSFPTMAIGDVGQQWNSSGCYWIKVKGLTAPSIAGKYFFKVFWTNNNTGYINDWYETYSSIDPRNYPSIVVKAEVDPGYIAGRVIYCAHTAYYYGVYYGDGVEVPGKVIAEGTTPEGRHVVGMAYFNASNNGYFEIEGLAPGAYTVTAYAQGMVPYTLPQEVTIMSGQSKHLTLCVQPSFKIQTRVYSKCPAGPLDWPGYVTWTSYPENLSLPVYGSADGNPWAGVSRWGYWAQYIFDEDGGFVSMAEAGWPGPPPLTIYPGNPAWDITVNNRWFDTYLGDPTCYSGVPTQWDGHVPQWGGAWTSGITPGTYAIRTNVFGYVQTQTVNIVVPETEHPGGLITVELDLMKGGTVRAQVHFHDMDLPSPVNPMRTSGNVLLEAYDSEGILRAFNHTSTLPGTNGWTNVNLTMIGIPNAINNYGVPDGVPYGMIEDTYSFRVYHRGYVQTEFPLHTITLCSNSSFSFHLIKGAVINVTLYSRDCQDPSQPRNWTYGPYPNAGDAMNAPITIYVVDEDGNKLTWGPLHQITGATWAGPFSTFALTGGMFPLEYWWWPTLGGGGGLDTGTYTIEAYTVGYVQYITPQVHVTRGTNSTANIPVYLQQGGRIEACVDFKVEMIPVGLLQDHNSYYFRLRAFNMDGDLAAANITAVPALSPGLDGAWYTADDLATTDWCFDLVGFSRWSTPMFLNSPDDGGWFDTASAGIFWPPNGGVTAWWQRHGYYEPTDLKQLWDTAIPGDSYGIAPGTYTITIEEELTEGRYVQLEEIEIVVTCAGAVERTFEVDQAPLIAGSVYTRNYMNDFRNGSWLAAGMSGSPDVGTYSYDGVYWSYYPLPGSQLVSVGLPGDLGYVGQSAEIATTWGSVSTGHNFWLEESGIPIPEFPVAIFALISALAASLLLIRWRRETILSVR